MGLKLPLRQVLAGPFVTFCLPAVFLTVPHGRRQLKLLVEN